MSCLVPAGDEGFIWRFVSCEDYTRMGGTEQTCATTLTEDLVLNATNVKEHGDNADEPAHAFILRICLV